MIPSLFYVKGLLIIEIAQLLISGDFVEITKISQESFSEPCQTSRKQLTIENYSLYSKKHVRCLT